MRMSNASRLSVLASRLRTPRASASTAVRLYPKQSAVEERSAQLALREQHSPLVPTQVLHQLASLLWAYASMRQSSATQGAIPAPCTSSDCGTAKHESRGREASWGARTNAWQRGVL